MREIAKMLFVFTCVVLVPTAAYAQAEISGLVSDTSGGVLPGVTVEAASPVLIEKVRTVITDSNGQYRIIDLRPGQYTVTFTLPGFNTVKREAVQLTGSFIANIDAEMRVGALQETVTVTGESPIVDTQSATRQLVLDRDEVQLIPSGRNYYSLGTRIVGVQSNSADVGGVLGDTMSSLTVHGSRNVDQRITNNGVSVMTLQAGGNIGGPTPDVSAATEITIDTSAVSAELPTGGVRVNFIPRDGGNTFSGSSYVTFSNEGMQGDNLTQRLQDRGLPSPDKNLKVWDINPAFGGPIKRDKVWFWVSGRYQGTQTQPAGLFANKNAWNPNAWALEYDRSQPAVNKGVWHSIQTRFTWQASQRHKFAMTVQQQNYCRCPWFIGPAANTPIRTPEAAADRRFPRLQQQHAEWTSPLTNRLLVEVVGMHLFERWGNMHLRAGEGDFFHVGGSLEDAAAVANLPQMISVTEQSTNTTYRMWDTFNNTAVPNYFYRAAVSYVTGTHNVKVGFNRVHGYLNVRTYDFQPVSYRFNQGVPNQVTIRATPYRLQANQDNDIGLFAQDRWTFDRWTLSGGIRFDMFQTSFPEQVIGPGPLVLNRNITFPAQDNLDWKDITYRSAAAWDVFGTGKTAFKVTLNKYLTGQTLNALGQDPNPFNTLVNTTNRSWNDSFYPVGDPRRSNYVPDCELTAPTANGECGAMANPLFGTVRPGDSFDPDLLTGWGHRNYNWEFSTSVQHEIVSGVSVDVGYFRRWFGNFRVTDNLNLEASDYDQFSLTAPNDPRLPGGGGYVITGLHDVKPLAFSRPPNNYNTLSDKYGKQIEHWNGMDFAVSARLQNGLRLQGGISTGKRVTDNCEIVAKLPELLFATNNATINLGDTNNNVWLPGQFCHQEEPFLTQAKLSSFFTIPRIQVLLAASFSSVPGGLIAANLVANNALLASSSTLGRSLSGNTANMTINIVEPGSVYIERLTSLDFRVGKILRFGGTRTTINLDLYNALNADTIRTVNNTFTAWQTPTSILLARFIKISATWDF